MEENVVDVEKIVLTNETSKKKKKIQTSVSVRTNGYISLDHKKP